jgi:tetratricopeptide (TPR) repeat protein
MKFSIVFVCLCACLTLVFSTAKADDNKILARQHFEKGQTHYKLGQFEEALSEYSQAYKLAPLAGFLFNIGQCHRRLEDYEQAIFFLKGYLREKPKAKNRALVENLIKDAEKKFKLQLEEIRLQEEQERKQEEQRRQALLKKQEQERRRAEEERKAHQLELAIKADQARAAALKASALNTKPEASPPFYKTWWFWTIVGGVVIGAGGGTAYALTSGDTTVLPTGSLGTFDRRGP